MTFVHDGFILDEDEALKAALSGLTVADEKRADRPVAVRYAFGEAPLVGDSPGAQTSWPFISIALLTVAIERDRSHKGQILYGHPAAKTGEMPIPMALDYEITTHARSARHDRQILSKLINGPLFPQGAAIDVDDGTCRRLDVLSGPENSDRFSGDGKREFRKVWTIRISSEIYEYALQDLATAVQTVGVEVVTIGS